MRYLEELLKRRDLPVWKMPVAYAADGSRSYTLAEVVASKPAIKSPTELENEEWRGLVLAQMRFGLEREREQPAAATYQLACPQGFVHGFEQAINELELRSVLGERIMADKCDYISALIRDVYNDTRSNPKVADPS